MSIGKNIERYRKLKMLTQQELAEKADISRISIGNYERDDRIPPLDVANDIAIALGIDLNKLIEPIDEGHGLGGAIKYHRKNRGLNQEELGKMIGKGLRMLQKYEANEVTPTLDVIKDLSMALDISPYILVEAYFEEVE